MTCLLPFLKGMLPYCLAAALLYLPCRALSLGKRRGKAGGRRFSPLRESLLLLLLLLFVGISSQTLLKDLGEFSFSNIGKKLNLLPFSLFRRMRRSRYAFAVEFLGNLLLFVPLGTLPPLLFPAFGFWRTVGGGALLSLTYEILQLPLGRFTDVDDFLLNTAGALLGYLLFLLIRTALPNFAAACRPPAPSEKAGRDA